MISVCGESPTVRQLFYCGDAYATVVSVDRNHGGTVTIPFTLAPDTSLEKQRCAEAASRRQMRLQVRPVDVAPRGQRLSNAALFTINLCTYDSVQPECC